MCTRNEENINIKFYKASEPHNETYDITQILWVIWEKAPFFLVPNPPHNLGNCGFHLAILVWWSPQVYTIYKKYNSYNISFSVTLVGEKNLLSPGNHGSGSK